jgi:hypothetical protein
VQFSAQRCFLHIGPPKTGTSYLQSIFWASRDELAAQGLVLPLKNRDHWHAALAVRGLLTGDEYRPHASSVLDRLGDAMASVQAGSNVLITQEAFAPATPAEAERLLCLLPGWEVHVIVTARDLSRQIPSAWQQRVKKGHTLAYDDFLHAVVERSQIADSFWSQQDLAAVTANWARVVPEDRLHIVTVPPSGSPAGLLLRRFCSVVGVHPGPLDTTAAVSNSSLDRAQAELLRHINIARAEAQDETDDLPRRAAKRDSTFLAKEVLAQRDGLPVELPNRLREWCHQLSVATIADLQSHGYHVVGDLAELIPNTDVPARADEHTTDAEVVRAAASALATLAAQRTRGGKEPRRRLKARRTGRQAGGAKGVVEVGGGGPSLP